MGAPTRHPLITTSLSAIVCVVVLGRATGGTPTPGARDTPVGAGADARPPPTTSGATGTAPPATTTAVPAATTIAPLATTTTAPPAATTSSTTPSTTSPATTGVAATADTPTSTSAPGPDAEAPPGERPAADPTRRRDPTRPDGFGELDDRSPLAHLPDPVCAAATDPEGLTALLAAGAPIIGADYQRALLLPDGRVLWLFQDAFLPSPGGPVLVHNAGLLQSGRCVQLLRSGTAETPAPYLLADLTDPFRHWFWPLGGGIGHDGRLHVFVAEVREHGGGYLERTEPVATWLVSIDVETLVVVEARPAPDPSADLYGWSVVTHGDHTFLYAHCYRQFGWGELPFADPPVRAHDWECAADVTVARIPRGRFDAVPRYWDGSEWTSQAAAAVPVIPTEGRSVNATQVATYGERLVAVTKVGDWWGDTVVLDVAPRPEGPWRTYEVVPLEPGCTGCNTYFASFVPFGRQDGSIMIGVSRNTWAGDDLAHYSPRLLDVPAPSLPG